VRAAAEGRSGDDLYGIVGAGVLDLGCKNVGRARNGALVAGVEKKHAQAAIMTGKRTGETSGTCAYNADIECLLKHVG